MLIDNYATKDDAIRKGIVEPIESGEASAWGFDLSQSADDFALEAIFSQVFNFVPRWKRFYHMVTVEEFWQIVEDNAL